MKYKEKIRLSTHNTHAYYSAAYNCIALTSKIDDAPKTYYFYENRISLSTSMRTE